jgi:hypothetical protein
VLLLLLPPASPKVPVAIVSTGVHHGVLHIIIIIIHNNNPSSALLLQL